MKTSVRCFQVGSISIQGIRSQTQLKDRRTGRLVLNETQPVFCPLIRMSFSRFKVILKIGELILEDNRLVFEVGSKDLFMYPISDLIPLIFVALIPTKILGGPVFK